MTFENLPCAHCRALPEEHVNSKCIFQPTSYAPLGEKYVLRTILFRNFAITEEMRVCFFHHHRHWGYEVNVWGVRGIELARATRYTLTESDLFDE